MTPATFERTHPEHEHELSMRTTRLLLPLVFVTLGCDQAAAPDAAANEASAPERGEAKAAADPRPQAPVQAPPPDSKATPKETPKPEPVPKSPSPSASGPSLHLVARAPAEDTFDSARFRVFGTRDGQVFAAFGPRLMRARADGTLDDDPRWLKGIHTVEPEAVTGSAWYVQTVGGRWPDDLFMTIVVEPSWRAMWNPHEVYSWSGDGWRQLENQRERYLAFPQRLVSWVEGSVLALRGFEPRYESSKYWLDNGGPPPAEEQAVASAIARAKPITVIRGAGQAPDLGDSMFDMDALDEGLLIAVASESTHEVIHYDNSARTQVSLPLPAVDGSSLEGVASFASDRAYAFGGGEKSPYLARFDGKAWAADTPPPCDGPIIAVSWAAGAGLWAICDSHEEVIAIRSGGLWRRAEGGQWQGVSPKDGERTTSVVARGADDVWVATTGGVYGPTAPSTVLECASNQATATTVLEYADPGPSLQCDDLAAFYVVLDAKPGAPRPTLDEALAAAQKKVGESPSLSIAEIQHRGETTVVLHAETYEMTAKNRKAIRAAFGDALEGTFCIDRLHR
ncbi:MAG: hypothetical protein ACRBN8_02245 [Nannocystales bacterium]